VDVPTYFDALSGHADTGFTNVTPPIKWQISPVPGNFDLSATFGAGLPTGTKAITGPGVQPYVQFPWSWELGGGWGLSGMLTSFIAPADPVNNNAPTYIFGVGYSFIFGVGYSFRFDRVF
jgi:hypothetical protein